MSEVNGQPELIHGANGVTAGGKPERSIRKTRIDKGCRRKPDPTEREMALAYFASLDIPGKQRFIDDCTLILKFANFAGAPIGEPYQKTP